jgi:ubiquitin-protein ligase
MNPLERLLTVLNPNTDKIVTQNDVEEILLGITKLLESYKNKTDILNQNTLDLVTEAVTAIKREVDSGLVSVEKVIDDSKESIGNFTIEAKQAQKILKTEIIKSDKKIELFKNQIATIESLLEKWQKIEVKDGYTPIKGVDYFTAKEREELIDVLRKESKLTAEELRDLLESLDGEEKLDASAIQNLPEIKKITGGGVTKMLRILGLDGLKDEDAGEITFGNNLNVTKVSGGLRVDATGGGGGGSSTYTGLTDAATADLPTINTPLSNALASKATPADISTAISNLVDTSPATLNTLNELAAALGDDPNFATTVSTQIGLKEDSANKVTTFTGNTASNVFFPTVKAIYDWAVATFASVTHTHTAAQITDFNTAVSANSDVTANTSARHTHANKALLDTYSQTEANLADAVAKKHSHTNIAILDATTASYTTTEQSKLSGIASGAEVNVNPDWNAVSGDAQILNKPTISGSNTGDQTSIVGITGTTAQFNTALTDGDFATLAGTETLTNKRITKRSQTITSTATLTPSWDTDDNIFITAQAAAITIANPTGTPTNGQTIMVKIKFTGAFSISFGTAYRAFGVALPGTSVSGKHIVLGLQANTPDSKVDTHTASEI